MILMKDSQDVCTFCTRNGSCVDIDIGIGSWSVSLPIQGLPVVYRQAERRKGHRFCFYGYCVATPIGYSSKMAQVKTMYDKPPCV